MKHMIKRKSALLLALLLVLGSLGGCGQAPAETSEPESAGTGESLGEGDTLRIVTTIFPLYDWTLEILGDQAHQAEVILLQDSGVDLHSYQPTAEDLLKLGDCDLFLYVGGESDDWAEDALAQTQNPDRAVLNLLEAMGDTAKAETLVEGMEAEDHEHGEEEHADEEHGDGDHQDGAQEEEAELDEHIWLSLKNAALLCDAIAGELGQIDPENGEAYRENAAAYQEKLAALDEAYAQAAETAEIHTILVADRFPFRYLADDYGLDYYAAFSGCSAETEASFETVAFLTEKLKELDLPAVLCIDGRQHQIPETVAEATGAPILSLDSMQSVAEAEGSYLTGSASYVSYLTRMESNLVLLRQALGA